MSKVLIAMTMLVSLIASFDAAAGMAFFKYERISGLNKICVYDYIGSEVYITIKSYELCPINIQV